MGIKNDIGQATAQLQEVYDDLSSFWDKVRLFHGVHKRAIWPAFGAGFTVCYLLAASFGVG
jgi:hypothetical protein